MAKIYGTKKNNSDCIKPDEQTIAFLLSYSKAYSEIKCKEIVVEIIAN